MKGRKVKVLGIQHIPRAVKEKTETRFTLRGEDQTVTFKESSGSKDTLVLYTSDGELDTKVFKGKWTLAQVFAWVREDKV